MSSTCLSAIALRLAAGALALGALAACGGDEDTSPRPQAQIEHVHGLGVNPADGDLMIATHSGLFRSPEGSSAIERVGESAQDTMGFTVVGPDRFLGSGHPAPGQGGPPNLGLIESTDGGASWTEISLGGEADFHVLRYAHGRVYGFNGLTGKLMVSGDGGETWTEEAQPRPMIDLAVDPDDGRRIVASTEGGLAISADAGARWRPLEAPVGLLAWPESKSLYLVDAAGRVHISEDAGRDWKVVGRVGAQPAAFAASRADDLFVALVDGTLIESPDGGASWAPR